MNQQQCEQIIWQHLAQHGGKTLLARQRWLWAHDRQSDYGAQDVDDTVWSKAYMAVHDALKDNTTEWKYVDTPADAVQTIGLAVAEEVTA